MELGWWGVAACRFSVVLAERVRVGDGARGLGGGRLDLW